MKQTKVSVIIPVYNTALFVEEAINSITDQTLQEIEIIVINDGSTDNSLTVVNKLSKQDKRIQVYSQENKGLSETRNRGIHLARGEYIYFMDSDDLLDKNALLECYGRCQRDHLDFAFFDADTFGVLPDKLNLNYHRTHLLNEEVNDGVFYLDFFFRHDGYQPSACLNFTKLDFLKRKDLFFYPGILHEDELFTFLLFLQAERVGCIHRAFYKRRFRENSIMLNSFSRKSMDSYITVISKLINFQKSEKDDQITRLVNIRVRQILGGVIYNARAMPPKDRYALIKECMKKLKGYFTYRDILSLIIPPPAGKTHKYI